MKKYLTIIVLLLAFILLLAACQGEVQASRTKKRPRPLQRLLKK